MQIWCKLHCIYVSINYTVAIYTLVVQVDDEWKTKMWERKTNKQVISLLTNKLHQVFSEMAHNKIRFKGKKKATADFWRVLFIYKSENK